MFRNIVGHCVSKVFYFSKSRINETRNNLPSCIYDDYGRKLRLTISLKKHKKWFITDERKFCFHIKFQKLNKLFGTYRIKTKTFDCEESYMGTLLESLKTIMKKANYDINKLGEK